MPHDPVPPDAPASRRPDTYSRRSFLKGSGGAALAGGAVLAGDEAQARPQDAKALSGTLEIELSINGETRKVSVEPRTTLLSALRHRLEPALTGSKEVCDQGNCGACSVIVDGRPAYSCMLLAVDLMGREIRTVEGLGTPEAMNPVQEAFCKHDALMCGFCTPGFVVAGTSCLERHPDADEARIREELSGNVCRCGTYPHILDAVKDAQKEMQR
jgi:xanthine dehydrogenase YagT iron-sulfur-binding subunit